MDSTAKAADFPVLLDAWLDAERHGHPSQALDRLIDVVAALPSEWKRRGSEGPSGRDFLLLNKLITRLQSWNLDEAALGVCDAARAYALEQGDRYGVLHFELLGVQSCVALLDFRAAAETLAYALGCELENVQAGTPAVVAGAANIAAPDSTDVDVHLLRIAALLAVGRYLAAIGRLAAAETALGHAIELCEQRESPLVSTSDVRLWLAEVRLDRGDLAGVEQLLDGGHESDKPSPSSLRWRVLRAQLFHLQGRFSAADGLLRDVADARQPALRSLTISAALQRIHVLAVVNRLDEAEEVLAGLGDALAAADRAAMRALIAARRDAASTALHTPPSPRQILVVAEPPDATPAEQARDIAGAVGELRRTRERVREEYGRLFNSVLLSLHGGDNDAALLLCAHVSDWSTAIDSDLIAARQQHLWALVYYYWSNWETAEQYATAALTAYEHLALPAEQWTMCRVLGWLLHRRGASRDELEHNQQRLMRLQDALSAGLEPTDQAMYALNKWSAVDEEVAALCHRLHEVLAALEHGRSPRLWRNWRRRRAALHGLRQVWKRRTRAGEDGQRGSFQRHTPAAHGGSDVYRLALEAMERRRAGVGEPRLSRWLSPRCMPSDTAVLQYIVLPDRLELFVVTRGGCSLIPLRKPTSRPELWECSRATLVNLSTAAEWRGDSRRLIDLSERIGLEEALTRLPATVCHLAIVPDDILVHLPFAALPVAHRPLIDIHSVSILPAMRWVPSAPGRTRPLTSGVGVAVECSPLSDRYPALKGAPHEIAAVGEEASGWRSLVNENATCVEVMKALAQVELAHFACHGDFFPSEPDRSGLLLTDGWLTVRDVYGLRLDHLTLAVLASCWGASATVLPGGDHIGLPFAFIDRGASAVIASLWKVPDASNVAFARNLHAAVRRCGPIAGLAATQREWAERAPPLQWAGYVAYAAGVAPRLPVRMLLKAASRRRANEESERSER